MDNYGLSGCINFVSFGLKKQKINFKENILESLNTYQYKPEWVYFTFNKNKLCYIIVSKKFWNNDPGNFVSKIFRLATNVIEIYNYDRSESDSDDHFEYE